MADAAEQTIKPFEKLLGSWQTEVTHPSLPGVVVRGTAVIEWLEGERFLIQRASNDHPQFPDFVAVLGVMDRDRMGDAPQAGDTPRPCMHYYDSRGVFRVFETELRDGVWRLSRMAQGFSQRFEGKFSADGKSIAGLWQMNQDDRHWKDDVKIHYRRQP